MWGYGIVLISSLVNDICWLRLSMDTEKMNWINTIIKEKTIVTCINGNIQMPQTVYQIQTDMTHWNLSKRNLPRELSYYLCYYFCLGQCLCLFLCTLNCKLIWGNSSVTGKGQKCKKIEKYSILMRLKSE